VNGEPVNGVGGVVIGGDYQGLGIARSLGRRGLPVCIIDDEHSISRYSRYASHAVRVRSLREPRETVDLILDVGRRLNLRGWVLYPTRDETVAALSNYRDVLSEWFRVPTPGWDTIRWVWDKRNTYTLARALGIPTPKTWFPQSSDDLRRIDGSFPLAIKPAIKEHFVYATKAKAWRANNPAELETRFLKAAALAPPGEIMVQDIIPGDGRHQFAYCAFFKHGKPLGTLVAQRCRQHPHEFGRASTFVKTVDMPQVELLSERFLRAIDYYGLVEVEFKRDPRDGEFKLLDVNARTWGYHGLGAAAGTDFTHLLFADQMGMQLPASRARQGVTWLRLLTDLPGGMWRVMRGQLGLGTYLKSVFRSHTEAVFSLDDPIPGIADIALAPYLIYKRGF
jgi:predicted ATP-grasp superfamily ATP-dependent carboligase